MRRVIQLVCTLHTIEGHNLICCPNNVLSLSDKFRFSSVENRMARHRCVKCNCANIKEM